jgi:glucuronate isomerase
VAVGTTDDPIDDLEAHRLLAADPTSPALVMPSFRPDKAMRADKPDFPQYLRKLEAVVGYTIDTIDKMRQALLDRIDYFASRGCRISDHGLDYCFYERSSDAELTATLTKARDGKTISLREQLAFHTDLMLTVGREYHRRNWVMQLHFGCLRNNSAKMFELIGADTGFDSINDAANGAPLAAFLSQLEKEDCLPKTILYSLNPSDNGVIGSMIGCFQTDGGISGKIQQGSAWWFNDHKDGMETQMRSLMSLGAMGTFNGMLTDSRSFLSYTRHEYFRRILCNLFGTMVEDGEYPADMETLNRMVENICYHNAVRYFDLVKDLK